MNNTKELFECIQDIINKSIYFNKIYLFIKSLLYNLIQLTYFLH